MNEDLDMSPETLKKIEALADRLETVGVSPEYSLATQTLMGAQRDNFEMLDRSLAMMQAVHNAESKNSDFYTDLLKFLIPLFATAVIAGLTVTIQNVNSAVLMWIGGMGLVASFAVLIPLIIKRHRRAKRQRGEYEKLAEAFKAWQSVADLQKKSTGDINNLDDAKDLVAQFTDLVNIAELFKKKSSND